MGNGYGVCSNQLPSPCRRLRCLVLSAVGASSGEPPALLHMTTVTIGAANCAIILSVQGHHYLLIELKLCNAITCISGKTGGPGRKLGPHAPAPA